jgi:hypothetical protein
LNRAGVAAYDAYWPSEAAMSEGDPRLIVELVLQGTADDVVRDEM